MVDLFFMFNKRADMEKRKRRILLAVLLLLSVVNYSRISSNSTIRTVEFISVLAIGILTGLLLRELFESVAKKKEEV
jgi:N-acyl-L-homoserine lactone synthetase